jgi:hypothetical protein
MSPSGLSFLLAEHARSVFLMRLVGDARGTFARRLNCGNGPATPRSGPPPPSPQIARRWAPCAVGVARYRSSNRKRHKADAVAAPARTLKRRALATAAGAACALPQLIARYVRAPTDHRDGARERRMVLAALTVHPDPGCRTLQVTKRRPRPWRRLMPMPGFPIGAIAKAEVTGFAAHDGESDKGRRGGSQPLRMVGYS